MLTSSVALPTIPTASDVLFPTATTLVLLMLAVPPKLWATMPIPWEFTVPLVTVALPPLLWATMPVAWEFTDPLVTVTLPPTACPKIVRFGSTDVAVPLLITTSPLLFITSIARLPPDVPVACTRLPVKESTPPLPVINTAGLGPAAETVVTLAEIPPGPEPDAKTAMLPPADPDALADTALIEIAPLPVWASIVGLPFVPIRVPPLSVTFPLDVMPSNEAVFGLEELIVSVGSALTTMSPFPVEPKPPLVIVEPAGRMRVSPPLEGKKRPP